ncbi:N-acetylmuramoyl-L-alanine amidase [Paenibacillaceae bacterium WGS1546]|uniref:N-acetylmuramoyl-L-alanine amidase family protein n=1 Tax=Cohnella sp. WGS1546 TaxID=3366810 RepID=UPI00372CF7F3
MIGKRLLIIGCSLALSTGWTAAAHEPPDVKRAIPTADVLIDAGHGGIDGGTHWNGILEKDINLAISRKLYLILRSKGYKVILNRTGDYALSDDNRWHLTRSRHRRDLSQRRGLSNEIGAKLFVSIHVNWSSKGNKRGPLVIHQSEGRSAMLARFIQDSLNRQQRRYRLPQAAHQYYLLNRVEIPSVIVETAFLSNPGDRAMLTSVPGQNRIAAAIAGGIVAYGSFCP